MRTNMMKTQALKKAVFYLRQFSWQVTLGGALACTSACNKTGSLPASLIGDRAKQEGHAQNSEETDPSSGQSSELNPISAVDSPLVDQFLALVTAISTRAPELNRERDRRGKLRQALSADLGAGCMQDVKVRSLELILSGQKLSDLALPKQARHDELPLGETEQANFEFSFGDMTFSDQVSFQNDEKQNNLFTANSHKIWNVERESFTIGKIQRLKIKKLSSSFTKQKSCSSGTAFSACSKDVSITELDRYHLDGLQIKVNGELIYARSDIGHTFAQYTPKNPSLEPAKSQGLGWSEDNMLINEAYVKMQQKDDCTAVQY